MRYKKRRAIIAGVFHCLLAGFCLTSAHFSIRKGYICHDDSALDEIRTRTGISAQGIFVPL